MVGPRVMRAGAPMRGSVGSMKAGGDLGGGGEDEGAGTRRWARGGRGRSANTPSLGAESAVGLSHERARSSDPTRGPRPAPIRARQERRRRGQTLLERDAATALGAGGGGDAARPGDGESLPGSHRRRAPRGDRRAARRRCRSGVRRDRFFGAPRGGSRSGVRAGRSRRLPVALLRVLSDRDPGEPRGRSAGAPRLRGAPRCPRAHRGGRPGRSGADSVLAEQSDRAGIGLRCDRARRRRR